MHCQNAPFILRYGFDQAKPIFKASILTKENQGSSRLPHQGEQRGVKGPICKFLEKRGLICKISNMQKIAHQHMKEARRQPMQQGNDLLRLAT